MARSRRVSARFQRDSLEKLEDRIVMSAALPHHPNPHYPHAVEVQVVKTEPSRTIVSSTPATPGSGHTFFYKLNGASMTGQTLNPPPGTLTPAQTRHIYAVDQVSDLGSGQTIAIVDAFDDPNIMTDADVFDQQFMTTLGGKTSYGAASTWLTKTSPSVVTPPGDIGWRQEISLDVEWMHAIAPLANEGRVSAGKKVLDGTTQTLPAIYAMTTGTTGSQHLYDVTSGRNRIGSAGPGVNLVTGRDTPRRSDLVYQTLVGY
jgi:hypothetical protein